jgi:hypothetical protein
LNQETGTLTIEGLDGVSAAFDSLDKKLQGQILSKAARAGGEVVKDAAVAEAPKLSGQTAGAVKLRGGRITTPGRATVTIGVGARDYVGDQFYAAFVLFGHHQGKRGLGSKRKWIKGNNWILRAFNRTKGDAADVVAKTIVEGVEQATSQEQK